MNINASNIDQFGIGHNFKEALYEQDLDTIVYGADNEEIVVRENPESEGGQVAWWKEPSYDRWWKVGPRGTED